jgi:hypothetical protein
MKKALNSCRNFKFSLDIAPKRTFELPTYRNERKFVKIYVMHLACLILPVPSEGGRRITCSVYFSISREEKKKNKE